MRPDDVADPGHYPYIGEDPVLLTELAASLRHTRDEMRALAPVLAHEIPAMRVSWPEGHAGDVAVLDVRRINDLAQGFAPPFGVATEALSLYVEDLLAGRRTVDVLNDAQRAVAPVEALLGSLRIPTTPEEVVERDRAETGLRMAAALTGFASVSDIDGAYRGVLRRVTIASEACTDALRRATSAQLATGSVTGGSVFASGLRLLTESGLAGSLRRAGRSGLPTDPVDLAAFWATLTSAERRAILESDPARLGNLDGIPVRDRDYANRLTLGRELGDGRAWFAAAGLPVPRTRADLARLTPSQRARLGLTDPTSILVLRRSASVAQRTAAALRFARFAGALAIEETLAFGAARLMTFDSARFGGEGRAAVAFGDPDSADAIALAVPGLESRVSKMTMVGGDARHLYEEASAADPTRSTAVIAWQGYDAPSFITVASQASAAAGGALLAADVRALVATHDGNPWITVVGHSYGSTTTGLALQRDGLAADVDAVAFVGSPGVGGDAASVADLGLRDDQLYVGMASRDVINVTANTLLGKDPLDPDFGGIRFRAESVERDAPGLGDAVGLADHSRYYDLVHHSESLYSLADIVTGHGDRLAAHDMLADRPNRDRIPLLDPWPITPLPVVGVPALPLPIPPYVDPEYARAPTDGHVHRRW
ncbi:MAG: alpha/beta hydrolase [Lapillicoccus sp.]